MTSPGRTTTQHQFLLRLPTDTFETLRAEASAAGLSLNALINEVLEEHLLTNRQQLIDMIGRAANDRYNAVLDKLADL